MTFRSFTQLQIKTLICVLSATLCLAVQQTCDAQALTLVNDYELNGTYSDSLGNGSDLIPIGGSLSASGFSFSDAEGLRLDTNVTSSDYRIEIDATFTDLSGWDKLIDFEDRMQDQGLYVNSATANQLRLFNDGAVSTSSVLVNTPYTIGLERNSGLATISLNGAAEFTVNDISSPIASSSVDRLHFFLDDTVTNGEGVAGTVTGIRIYTVPEPSPLVTVGLFCIIAAAVNRRRFGRSNEN